VPKYAIFLWDKELGIIKVSECLLLQNISQEGIRSIVLIVGVGRHAFYAGSTGVLTILQVIESVARGSLY
jgi:hypothetical protein